MADTPKKHRVFVYGTLKRGIHNHRLLETSDFIGEAYTVDTFRMYQTGFPVLFLSDDPNARSVFGEVYDVNDETLARLDQLESEGRMYDRKKVNVQLIADEPYRVIDANVGIYIGNSEYWKNHKLPEFTEVNNHGELQWHP